MKVALADDVEAAHEQGAGALRLIVDRRVDRNGLELVPESGVFRERPDGSREALPALRVRDDERPEHVLAVDFLSAVSFLGDVPLSVFTDRARGRFVPEDDGDRETLADLGTDDVYRKTGGRPAGRTFGGVALTAECVSALLGRSSGLRIYADALKLGTSVQPAPARNES